MADVQQYSDNQLDLNELKRQLLDTTTACNRCMEALDSHVGPDSKENTPVPIDSSGTIEWLQMRVATLENEVKIERERAAKAFDQMQWMKSEAQIFQNKEKMHDIESKRFQAENERLCHDVLEIQKRLTTAEEVIASLTSSQSTSADAERMQILEEQLQTFKEDFDFERRAHAKDLEKINHLERENTILRQQLRQQMLQYPAQRRFEYCKQDSGNGRGPVTSHGLLNADNVEDEPNFTQDAQQSPDAATEAGV